MRKAGIFVLISLLVLFSLVFSVGCGGESAAGMDEEVVRYAIDGILIPEIGDSVFVVAWMRKSTGPGDVDPRELYQRMWKWEGGTLSEISLEEYNELASLREGDNPNIWIYSQHSVTILDLDPEKGEAEVEVGSLYSPLSGSGVRYLLRREDGEWKKVSEETVWVSRSCDIPILLV